MAYRIKRKEGVGGGVRRIVRQQLHEAVQEVANPTQSLDDRVHAVRSHLKRTRSVVRLVADQVGGPARKDERRFRALARRLSLPRDIAVQDELLHRLLEQHPEQVAAGADQSLRDIGRRLRKRMDAPAVDARLRAVVRALAKVTRQVARWSVPHGKRAVRKGLESAYRQARRRLRAIEQPADEGDQVHRLHQWRKSIKRLGHQVTVLRRRAPELNRVLQHPLADLGELLGEAHDLSALRATLQYELRAPRDSRNRALLLALIDQRARVIESEAVQRGHVLVAASPKAVRQLLP